MQNPVSATSAAPAQTAVLVPYWWMLVIALLAFCSVIVLLVSAYRRIEQWERFRSFLRRRPGLLALLQDNQVVVIAAGIIIGVGAYSLTLHSWPLFHAIGQYFPRERQGTRHYVNIVAVVGLVFAGVGIWFTYIQLRLENSKVEQYRSFYRWVDVLFKELQSEPAAVFHFFGSTILPGNLAYINNRQVFDDLENKLRALYTLKDSHSGVSRAVILVPDDIGYRTAYEYYKDHIISTASREQKKAWPTEVEKARERALDLQHALMNHDAETRHRYVHAVSPSDTERFSWLQKAYYMSNGRRAIYAVPLHYLSSSLDGQIDEVTPSLIGMTTTNPGVIDALEQLFNRLCETLPVADKVEDLRAMYSQHPIKASWVAKKVEQDLTACVDQLVAVDVAHDHFLGRQGTDACISAMAPLNQGSNVLDLGSGLGGPAIYIQLKYDCHSVVGVELQPDRVKCAQAINRMTSAHIHVCEEDMLAHLRDFSSQGRYSHIISILSILHCPHKRDILESIGAALDADGSVCIEDYISTRHLTETEKDLLTSTISCPSLLSLSEYVAALESGGVVSLEVKCMTESWHSVAAQRVVDFGSDPPNSVAAPFLTPDEIVKAREFSAGVETLFKNGIIAGVRISGRKAANA
jgi:2-polyprenyl-3-methyl-5-hydroxy-6-metoxy-1,4-benzoquinol methylase